MEYTEAVTVIKYLPTSLRQSLSHTQPYSDTILPRYLLHSSCEGPRLSVPAVIASRYEQMINLVALCKSQSALMNCYNMTAGTDLMETKVCTHLESFIIPINLYCYDEKDSIYWSSSSLHVEDRLWLVHRHEV